MVAMRKTAPPRIKYHWNTAQQGVNTHSTAAAAATHPSSWRLRGPARPGGPAPGGRCRTGTQKQHFSLLVPVQILTYLAKKDFCSCGFFSFFSDSCSRRSMNSAVSGLPEEKSQ